MNFWERLSHRLGFHGPWIEGYPVKDSRGDDYIGHVMHCKICNKPKTFLN